ncbi:ABC transporter substrate-binding protein [Corynebacterium mendelii]|uniref:Extracellular solute-binding protein n=1 Tax=Corynebacterium mendelii TaxID=2765362 RepID=A0A939DYR0_9CORY|nr:extracellular solute-binding protein [Corynebacterium mendelii]MBN9643705.1 extracellular solute-binding protein [Corynebacterium mendelii]
MRNAFKKAAAVLVGISTAVTMSACGAGGGSSSDENVPIASGDDIKGDITMWSSFTQGPRAEWMDKKAAEFEKAHPGTNITIEKFSWGEFNTKWTTGLTSGQVPDISTALPTQVVEMINADALTPIGDVIDQLGRDRFFEPSLKEGEQDGKNFSIPIYSHAQVMWYRKDILEENGLDVPETWDELNAAVDKIGSDGDNYAISVPMGTNDFQATRFLNFYVRSKGETLLNDDGTANLTSPAAMEGIKYWTDMFKKASPQGSVNYNVLDQATLFYQGKTAFDFNSGFHISGVQKNRPDLADKVAAAPLPVAAKGDKSNYPAEVTNAAMVVWRASDNAGTAKAFLEFLYDDDEYIEFLHSVPGGMLPAMKDINDNPKYLDNETIEKYQDSVQVIADQVAVGSAIGMENGPTVQAGILTSQGIIERMMQSIVLDGADPADAAKKAEDELNQQFKAAGVQ